MTVGFSALGTVLTGRLAVAPKVNSLPVIGMPCQWNTPAIDIVMSCMHMCVAGVTMRATAVKHWKVASRAA